MTTVIEIASEHSDPYLYGTVTIDGKPADGVLCFSIWRECTDDPDTDEGAQSVKYNGKDLRDFDLYINGNLVRRVRPATIATRKP